MRFILLTFLSLMLTACGFKPLLEAGGSSKAMQSELSAIFVEPIPDRLGQVTRHSLMDRLNVGGTEKYSLHVVFEQSSEGYGVRPDAATTQEQITMAAYVKLVSYADNSVLFEDTLKASTSFDIVLSDYATVTQREDSARRLALELAERIHRRLALHFAAK